MNTLAIKRALTDSTRKEGVMVNGKMYSLHITHHREAIITDNKDYSKIYAVMTLDFYNAITTHKSRTEGL